MLKDAALLQLDLLERALAEDLILKDSTPYNVQWRGVAAGLHRRRLVRAPRAGRALVRLPAVLHALPLPAAAPGLQGDRVPAVAARAPGGDPADRGARGHVASATSSAAACRRTSPCTRGSSARTPETARDVKQELRKAGFKKELHRRQRARAARSSCAGSTGSRARPSGTEYGATTSYTDEDAVRKEAFVREVVHEPPRGSSPGTSAATTATTRGSRPRTADYVVAVDGDAAVVDGLYRALRDGGRDARSCRSSAT